MRADPAQMPKRVLEVGDACQTPKIDQDAYQRASKNRQMLPQLYPFSINANEGHTCPRKKGIHRSPKAAQARSSGGWTPVTFFCHDSSDSSEPLTTRKNSETTPPSQFGNLRESTYYKKEKGRTTERSLKSDSVWRKRRGSFPRKRRL